MSVRSANRTFALVHPNGDWHYLRTLNFTYFPQITLVSELRHDPMITDNVLNPPKEW